MARPRPAYVAASAVVAAGLLAGCGGSGSSGTQTPGPWSSGAGQQAGMVPGTMPAASQQRKVVDATRWSFTLASKTNPDVPTDQWPSADEVLTQAQLQAAIPEASSVSLGDCVKGKSAGTLTAKNASCTWSVSLKGAGDYTSSITVTIVAIGADKTGSGVTSAWTSVRNKNFGGRASTDHYFTQGSFGAKGSYYLDNNQASVLVSDGNVAAWINLTFIGFNSLPDSRNTLMTGVFPVLAQDLANRLPRKYA